MGKQFEAVARGMIWCAGLALFGTAFLVFTDVMLRRFFHFSIPGTDEVASFAFAFSTSWAYAFVAIKNANIRIDFPYMTFPRWLRLAADLVAMTALAGFLLWLAWIGFLVAEVSYELDQRVLNPLRLPMFIFQILWAFGLLMGAVAALVALARTLRALVQRDYDAAERLGGGSEPPEERALV